MAKSLSVRRPAGVPARRAASGSRGGAPAVLAQDGRPDASCLLTRRDACGSSPSRGGGRMVPVSTPSIPEVSIGNILPDAVLLDVREDDEWAAGRAPGAVHVPRTQLAERLEEIPDGHPVYVICRSGGRSARVTAYLNSQGWDTVNVAGGMGGWAAAGKPMVADGD